MENASKALIMAGSVLVSLLIISIVVYMFSDLTNTQSDAEKTKEIMQITEYNKKFEQYNRTILYGSDIISVMNLVEDYNRIQASEELAYTPMTLNIIITREISLIKGYTIKPGTYVIKKLEPGEKQDGLTTVLNSINNSISVIGDYYNSDGRKPIDTMMDLYSKNNKEKAAAGYTGRDFSKIETEYKKEIAKSIYRGRNVEKDIIDYTNLTSTLTNFKAKYFTCDTKSEKSLIYDSTGRMTTITFREVIPN